LPSQRGSEGGFAHGLLILQVPASGKYQNSLAEVPARLFGLLDPVSLEIHRKKPPSIAFSHCCVIHPG
jgi:hypothetical protein